MNNLRQVKDIAEYHTEPDAEYWIQSQDARRDININDYHVRGIRKMIENGELYVKSNIPTVKVVKMRCLDPLQSLVDVPNTPEAIEHWHSAGYYIVNTEVVDHG